MTEIMRNLEKNYSKQNLIKDRTNLLRELKKKTQNQESMSTKEF